jgi:SAM-dependent methyltransferase
MIHPRSRRLKPMIKRAVHRSPSLTMAALVATNAVWGYRLWRGRLSTNSGTAHAALTIRASVDYIEKVVEEYRKYGAIDHFRGRVAEIGPGDNAGVALLMRRDGCDAVDLVDRFRSRYDPLQQAAIYDALSQRHGLQDYMGSESWDADHLDGVSWRSAESAESFFAQCEPRTYDFIVSRAVVEHLYDPIAALRSMVKTLRPGGKMLHEIDLRDHEFISAASGDELSWLRVPSWLWRCMTSYSGRPNRVLSHQYRKVLDELAHQGEVTYSLLVTSLAGAGPVLPYRLPAEIDSDAWSTAVGAVRRHRHRLARELRAISDRDLAVTGMFLVVERR